MEDFKQPILNGGHRQIDTQVDTSLVFFLRFSVSDLSELVLVILSKLGHKKTMHQRIKQENYQRNVKRNSRGTYDE